MRVRSFAAAAAALAIGYAMTAALFWALLNVPESNVPALVLSVALVLLIAVAAGLTTAAGIALFDGGSLAASLRRAIGALPGFLLGLAIFALLWWVTGVADGWWQAHSGEADAVVLRYLGSARTDPIHEGVSAATWLVRWPIGLSVLGGLVAAGTYGGTRGAARGLRTALRIIPFLATTAALVVGEELWRLVYWRPKLIPPNWLEPAFVAAKLSVLYLLAIVMATIVLYLISRHVLPDRI